MVEDERDRSWLWAGTLAHATLEQRIEAAVAGGCSRARVGAGRPVGA